MWIREAIKAALLPIASLCLYLVFLGVWSLAGGPREEQLLDSLKLWNDQFGVVVITLAAFSEGLFVVGLYFPGSSLIVLSVALASGPSTIPKLVAFISAGFVTAYVVNFCSGRTGLYAYLAKRETVPSLEHWTVRLRLGRKWWPFLAYWHPLTGAPFAVASGAFARPVFEFLLLMIPSVLAWNIVWGVVVYLLADVVASSATNPRAVIGFFLLWIILESAPLMLRKAP